LLSTGSCLALEGWGGASGVSGHADRKGAQDILQYQLQLNQSDPSFNNREPAPLIAAGEEVCKGLDSGKSVDKVGVDLGNAHFSSVEAADIVLAATSNLCTDHQQEVKNWAGM